MDSEDIKKIVDISVPTETNSVPKNAELIQLRRQCAVNGMFQTRAGIYSYYADIECLDADEAEKKTIIECKNRGIYIGEPQMPKNNIQKTEQWVNQITSIIQNPSVQEYVLPLLGGAASALSGVWIGNNTSDQNMGHNSNVNLDDLEEEKINLEQ